MAHDLTDDQLRAIEREIEGAIEALDGTPSRTRDLARVRRHRDAIGPPQDGDIIDHHSDCVVSGAANPLGVGASFRRRGDEVLGATTVGPAFGDAFGAVHEGVITGMLDDLLGAVLMLHGHPAFTAELIVRFHTPVPTEVELTLRGRQDRVDGRKLALSGEVLLPDSTLAASAEGLFIVQAQERPS